jgi:hypothetical protein
MTYQTLSVKERIEGNPYVGRGIIIGKSEDGKKAVFAYFIMGRSENSRNRVFVENGEEITIYPYDPSKVEDPSLIIYSPIRKFENKLVVTNGDQTDTVIEFLEQGKTFEEALDTRCFEPDAPNYTPRISGMLTFEDGDFTYKMNILKSADPEGTECNRYNFAYKPLNGLGHFIHTYMCDGNPIPTFTGEPERVAIPNDIDEFTDTLWNNLNSSNKISLYVRYISLENGSTMNKMINGNEK